MSNNPQKVEALTKGGIEVIELIACEAPPNPYAVVVLADQEETDGAFAHDHVSDWGIVLNRSTYV